MQPPYIQERLDSLAKVDEQLCSLLQTASQVVFTYGELKHGNHDLKPQFEQHTSEFYTTLESATSQLKKEMRLLDENIGIRLLPINVSKKALGQDDDKLLEQTKLLKEILHSQSSQ
ncbi:MED11 (YMR112C) [Zygosaccharomyces parabailii]|uniref:Mediator of RNA polymerase II transcription subunit 11 n=1 Tax=Zygosaccharomyces bailii (strain CLIB 213 / ATCC 58445 / CBS 680 / BCRC 21525 / NBRC 1098 / NCYC 1416 / NRRL Y-2227) TaxID=1333698 RepID=A0A8J2T6F1_ZYGB2|nr:MED11 (YMR112C) [Zygosaccharomyces parabailii]CDF88991.1 ZYBA0S03-06612g1_1 [Zygosaccharomyces bailii CLIB 213]SJM83130.1 probable Mediator of RNA polymerase II transcription subunit 11 [Zygosaccharomyces bailii]